MSGLIVGLVWELPVTAEFSSEDKFVALAYADHAWQDGTHAYPSIALIAEKTGYFERTVQRHVRRLEKLGLLVLDGKGKMGTNSYTFPLKKRPDGSPFLEIPEVGGCQSDTPSESRGVSPVTPEGMTPEEMTPEPKEVVKDSDNDNESQPVRPNIFALYEQNIGPITSLLADDLVDAEKTYPAEWVLMAFKIAVENNARNWKYVKTVLQNIQARGPGWKPGGPAAGPKKTTFRPKQSFEQARDDLTAWLQEP